MDIKAISNVSNEAVIKGQTSSDIERAQTRSPVEHVKKQNEQELKNLSKDELESLFKRMKEKFDYMNKYLKIEIDKDLHEPIIKIIDKKTNEVVRQIPPEHLLELAKKIDELVGLLFSKEA